MRRSGKEAKHVRLMQQGAPVERREALAVRSDSEWADELGHDARSGQVYGRRHPPMTRG